jgi:hypothetical protein
MKTLILTIVAVSLSACSPTVNGRVADFDKRIVGQLCRDVMPHISYDGKLDTQPTKDQIKQYNAGRDAFCK